MTMSEKNVLLEQLRFVMQDWVSLSERQWQMFSGIFTPKSVAAGDHLLQPGDGEHDLWFVCDGLLRFYYLGEHGAESNKAFIETGFAGPLAASALGLPVIYGVEALEDSQLLAADFMTFRALFDEHPVFERFGRKLAELLLMRKELRTRSLLQQSATERYLSFKHEHPNLLRRVPQYQIASYLGITEVSLSRIKRELMALSA